MQIKTLLSSIPFLFLIVINFLRRLVADSKPSSNIEMWWIGMLLAFVNKTWSCLMETMQPKLIFF
jgi:hypothetical protein